VNILLIQLKRIGDLILTTPAIAALREKFPDAQISLVTSSGCAELLPAISKVNRKLVANKMGTLLEISRRGFDYCVDFTRNDRSSFLTRLSRANVRTASERRKQRTTFRSRAYNRFVIAPLGQLHTTDYYLKLLEPFHIHDRTPNIELNIPQDSQSKATALQNGHKIGRSFIVFHPGSARAEKFWETKRWSEVIEHARRRYDFDLVLTGGQMAFERNHLAQLTSQLARPIIDLSGKTDLLTLAALVSRARLLVTVDSAPMHFAGAARVPQVALFGPTNPFHWRPRYDSALILQGKSQVPMSQFSPEQAPVPMKQISTRAVIDAMDALLSSPMA
jgi:heptosyltransferase III